MKKKWPEDKQKKALLKLFKECSKSCASSVQCSLLISSLLLCSSLFFAFLRYRNQGNELMNRYFGLVSINDKASIDGKCRLFRWCIVAHPVAAAVVVFVVVFFVVSVVSANLDAKLLCNVCSDVCRSVDRVFVHLVMLFASLH